MPETPSRHSPSTRERAAPGAPPQLPRRPMSRPWAVLVFGTVALQLVGLVIFLLFGDPGDPDPVVLELDRDGTPTGLADRGGIPAADVVADVLADGSNLPDSQALPDDVNGHLLQAVDALAAGRRLDRLSDSVRLSSSNWRDRTSDALDFEDENRELVETWAAAVDGTVQTLVDTSHEASPSRADYLRLDRRLARLLDLTDVLPDSGGDPRLGRPYTIGGFDDSDTTRRYLAALDALDQPYGDGYGQNLDAVRSGRTPAIVAGVTVVSERLPEGFDTDVLRDAVVAHRNLESTAISCAAADPDACADIEVWRHEAWLRTNALHDEIDRSEPR